MSDQVTTSLAQAKVLVMQGMAGKAPRVNATNNHWEVYDNETAQWVDTGANVTGADGVSPGVFISNAFNGKTIKITDAQHPDGQFFTIYNGTNGLSPYIDTTTKTWWYYDDASNLWVDSNIHAQGDPGVSPEVTVESIQGGHTVTITDEDHPQGQSFNVMNGLDGISEDVKVALLNCFEHVAWIDADGQDYYDALEAALYPPKTLVSISAAFNQGSAVIYDTDDLDTLKQYLTVTAYYDDSSTGVVTSYTLSGTLTEGTSTITVLYNGKTTTFNVTVTEHLATLDDIAYGSLTYRDIFITNNKINYLGDFESSSIAMSTQPTLPISGQQDNYRINTGTPTLTTDDSNTTSHSLKVFGSSSNQLVQNGFNGTAANTKYLVACSAKVTRYSAGFCGMQGGSPNATATARFYIGAQSVTNGWEYFTDLLTMPTTDYFTYIGSWSSANLDGYVDDVVVSPVPSGMTAEEAQALYEEYIAIRKRGET